MGYRMSSRLRRARLRVISAVAALLLVTLPAFALPEHVGGQWGPVLLWPHVPVSIAKNAQFRVHVAPRIMNVAVPHDQHSPRFGQCAELQTV